MAKGIHFLNMSFEAHTFVPTQMLGLQYTSYNHFAVPRYRRPWHLFISAVERSEGVARDDGMASSR